MKARAYDAALPFVCWPLKWLGLPLIVVPWSVVVGVLSLFGPVSVPGGLWALPGCAPALVGGGWCVVGWACLLDGRLWVMGLILGASEVCGVGRTDEC